MPKAEKRVVSVPQMGKAMLSFAIACVTEGDCLVSEIERNVKAVERMADPDFWFEFYAFALFPCDVALFNCGVAQATDVRREATRQAYENLSSFFAKKSQPHMSVPEWNQLYHDRTAEYWDCIKDGTGKALELLGMVATMRILKTPDMLVSVCAALSYANSFKVLPDLINCYEIHSPG